jgi:nitrogen-specific signal transduction histidine kinase
MFEKIQYRLLCSYLVVFTCILSISAIAIRLIFVHSLKEQLITELTTLAKAAEDDLKVRDGHLHIDDNDLLNPHDQGLQWFNPQKQLLFQQGSHFLSTPLVVESGNPSAQVVQLEVKSHSILGVTVPIRDDDTGKLIGYIRTSQSLNHLHDTIHRLDWGLGAGIVVALVLSGAGGIWLTRQSMQPIEKNVQQLKQFTTDASHELRSPLMVIKSNAAVALRYPEGIRTSDIEKFQEIAIAAQQMTTLTEDLLLLARIGRKANRKPEVIDLSSLLTPLIQHYQTQAEAKSIEFKDQLAKNLFVFGDRSQLARLFSNLLENALRYTPPEDSVYLQTTRRGRKVIIKVEDTGIGIAPDHLERIFDRFWRSDQARSQWENGSGLGLAIAQEIAQNHHGLITVSSQLGAGSCFTVELPVHEA